MNLDAVPNTKIALWGHNPQLGRMKIADLVPILAGVLVQVNSPHAVFPQSLLHDAIRSPNQALAVYIIKISIRVGVC